ncbi:hypothetical protein OS133_02945 [Shewanella fidelis]|uniref:GIY-YIG nuclease family protein n=1 Tax=Shewanella fidelis TaxID=173509 RepID=A0AAW8NIT4_9GAMM|nr:hypothetical protein [Shewanella fidelis]MDR8522655.1 hypothetical protein [Shewanella fidelis]MDW4816065.1 hypothetical protein [Shewanella fidelis]MDW4824734.1 hypothetical protein [Shewanella fidelis]
MLNSELSSEQKAAKKEGFRAGYHTPGIIYCFFSKRLNIYKVGRTRLRVEERLRLANTTQIAEVNDWELVVGPTILSPEAGHSETRIAALLCKYR